MSRLAKADLYVAPAEPGAADEQLADTFDERLIVIAPVGSDASAIATLLTEHGFQATVCEDPAGRAAEIRSAGALVMTEEALEFTPITELLHALESQPP